MIFGNFVVVVCGLVFVIVGFVTHLAAVSFKTSEVMVGRHAHVQTV